MPERRRVTQLAGGNPSIRLAPFPAGSGSTLQPFLQIRDGHRISVYAHVLGEEAPEGLQTAAFEIAVNFVKPSNNQGKTRGEAQGCFCVAIHKSGHMVELSLAKKESNAPCRVSREHPKNSTPAR